MGLEDADVGAGRSVEGDLLAHRRLGALDLVVVPAGDDEGGARQRHLLALAAHLRESGLDVREHGFIDVLDRMEGMDVEAVGELAGEPAHVGVQARDVDLGQRTIERRGAEERRHQAELVVLALEPGPRAVLPHVPDVADQEDHLAEPRARRQPRRRVAALVVALHLRAEPEDEAAARGGLEVPGDLGVDERAAREGHGDVGADRDALGRGRRERGGEIRVVARLRRPETVVPEPLRVRGEPGRVAQVGRHEAAVDLHAAPLLECRARGQARRSRRGR